jgi:uncharacterized protein
MAMNFSSSSTLAAPPSEVWAALNNPDVLQACLPGCKALHMNDAQHFEATVQIKVGPVAATFKGKVALADLNPPHSYTLMGEGNAGAVGFARVSARVRLTPQGEGTELTYEADVEIGGKLASVGARLIQSAARKNVDDFFAALEAYFSEPDTVNAEALPSVSAPLSVPRPASTASGLAQASAVALSPAVSGGLAASAIWAVAVACTSAGLLGGLVAGYALGHFG